MATAANGVTVPAGTDVFQPATDMAALNSSLHGRIMIPAANATARTALATTCGWTPTVTDPLIVYQTDTNWVWTYNGSAWSARVGTLPVAVAAGVVNITTSTTTGVEVAVTYPAGTFTATPIVTATVQSGVGGAIKATVLITNTSSTGCSVRIELNAISAGTYPVNWIAIQMV